MKVEDYFDFLSENDIRVKGTRIGIETILYEYIYRERSAKQIREIYPSLHLEQIYATILYYLQNRRQVTHYLENWLKEIRQAREIQEKQPPSIVRKLRRIKENQHRQVTSE